jgi:hypothetical protein
MAVNEPPAFRGDQMMMPISARPASPRTGTGGGRRGRPGGGRRISQDRGMQAPQFMAMLGSHRPVIMQFDVIVPIVI